MPVQVGKEMLTPFRYEKPRSVEKALDLLVDKGTDARLLAGGTDLIPQIRSGKIAPALLIDLLGFTELKGIEIKENHLGIGSMTTIRELERSKVLQVHCPVLKEAAGLIGSRQIRNVATVGGNICNASPSADLLPSLLALESKVTIRNSSGTVEKRLDEFFLGPSQTILANQDILTKITVPKQPVFSGASYLKLSPRRAMDLAIVGVTVLLVLSETGTCQKAHLVLGSVAPTPIRVPAAEEILIDSLSQKSPSDALLDEVGEVASQAARPIKDVRASDGYRRDMIKVLVKRGIKKALERAHDASRR
jgi:carbon-monoxide dehydrogenase medium subunit